MPVHTHGAWQLQADGMRTVDHLVITALIVSEAIESRVCPQFAVFLSVKLVQTELQALTARELNIPVLFE